MSNLRPSDRERHANLGITDDWLEAAGVMRVSDAEARNDFGIRGSGDMSGIVYPYWDPKRLPDERRRTYCRIRRDEPEIGDNGKPNKKYVAPYSDRPRHYFAPIPELFNDASVPIVYVEGEKSVLSVAAWARRNDRKYLPIGLGGCHMWRCRTGIKTTASGERVPVTGPNPDLQIARGRKAYVLFDANVATNPRVASARRHFVKYLRDELRCDVSIVDLPVGAWNGPDDYIAAAGDRAMCDLFDGVEDGVVVLDDVLAFVRRFVIMTYAQAAAVALWIAHTYAYESFVWTPYLGITSPGMRCGKSRLLEVIGYLVNRPRYASGASGASLFREIDHTRGTLMLDELDTIFRGNKEVAEAVRQVLNSGAHFRGSVLRCVGTGASMTVKEFRTFGPKALSGIGKLLGTVADRSLNIRLRRKRPSETVESLRERVITPEANKLKNRLQTWVEQQRSTLQNAEPEMPGGLNDRQRDGAEPLLAIADAAGGHWSDTARTALLEISSGSTAEDQALSTRLLADIQTVFEGAESEVLPTRALLNELEKCEHGIWAEFEHGKPLGPRKLSSMLWEFDIGPRTIRRGVEQTFKGYRREMFEDSWARYVTPAPVTPSVTSSQSNGHAGGDALFHPSQGECELPSQFSIDAGCDDVTDNLGEKGNGIGEEARTRSDCCRLCGSGEFWYRCDDNLNSSPVCVRCHPPPEGE